MSKTGVMLQKYWTKHIIFQHHRLIKNRIEYEQNSYLSHRIIDSFPRLINVKVEDCPGLWANKKVSYYRQFSTNTKIKS